MVEVSPKDILPSEEFEEEPRRRYVTMLFTVLACSAIFTGYMSLVSLYISERSTFLVSNDSWIPDGVRIPLTQPNYMGFTILLSVITVWWTYYSARNKDRTNAVLGSSLTLLFLFGFVAQTFYLLSLMDMGAADSNQAVYIYGLVGGHLALAILSGGILLASFVKVLISNFRLASTDTILASAIVWSLISILYFVLWYTVYITK